MSVLSSFSRKRSYSNTFETTLLQSEYLGVRPSADNNSILPDTSAISQLLRKRNVDIGERDKVFASQWIDKDHIIYGTKCNSLVLLNVNTSKNINIPLIDDDEHDLPTASSCGIHAIQINKSRTFLATGGSNIHTVGVYQLPDLSPHCLFHGRHTDWIFDLRWIDDQHVVSCSRDASLIFWAVPDDHNSSSECSRISRPVTQSFSKLKRDRLRALEYLPEINRLTVATISRRFYVYDPVRLGQCNADTNTIGTNGPVYGLELNEKFKECVALRRWPDHPNCVALASHGNVLLFDIRCENREVASLARIITLPAEHAGVRSINFNKDVISFGTSSGIIHFYSMTSGKSFPTQYKLDSGFVRNEHSNSESQLEVDNSSLTTNSRISLPPRLRNLPPPPNYNDSRPRRPIIYQSRDSDYSDSAFVFNSPEIQEDRVTSPENTSDDEASSLESTTRFSSSRFHQIYQMIMNRNRPSTNSVDFTINSSRYTNSPRPNWSRSRNRSPSPPRIFPLLLRRHMEERFNIDFQQRLRNPLYLMRITGLSQDSPDSDDDDPLSRIRARLQEDFDIYNPIVSPFSNRMQSPAVYTHEYDLQKMRIFAAGGPIASAYYGNAAAIWE